MIAVHYELGQRCNDFLDEFWHEFPMAAHGGSRLAEHQIDLMRVLDAEVSAGGAYGGL